MATMAHPEHPAKTELSTHPDRLDLRDRLAPTDTPDSTDTPAPPAVRSRDQWADPAQPVSPVSMALPVDLAR